MAMDTDLSLIHVHPWIGMAMFRGYPIVLFDCRMINDGLTKSPAKSNDSTNKA